MIRVPIVFLMLFAPTSVSSYAPSDSPVSDSVNAEEQPPPEEPTDCEKASKDLKNDIVGLEMYLQDKKDYKLYCPRLKWEQPKLAEYKKDPKSHLPEKCEIPKT